MGKGDKKTKKGKITLGSYGVSKPRKKKNKVSRLISPVSEKPEVKAPKKSK